MGCHALLQGIFPTQGSILHLLLLLLWQMRRSLAGYSPWGRKESDTTKHSTQFLPLASPGNIFTAPKNSSPTLIPLSPSYHPTLTALAHQALVKACDLSWGCRLGRREGGLAFQRRKVHGKGQIAVPGSIPAFSDSVSPLHTYEFYSQSMFLSPICS